MGSVGAANVVSAQSAWGFQRVATTTDNLYYSTGSVGIGTTSPYWALTVSASTSPQLALTDGSLTSNIWTLRSAGGNLYVATSSPSTFATSSVSALTINSSGQVGLGTSTPSGSSQLAVSGTSYFAGNVSIGTPNPFSTALLTVAGSGSTDTIVASTTDVTTGSLAVFEALSDASKLLIASHGSARVATRDGITLGGWNEILSGNNLGTNNGLLIDTQQAAPIVLGTNAGERLRITSSGTIGVASTTPWAQFSVDTSNLAANVPEFDIGSSTRSDFTVTQAGNVGIGSTTPSAALDVNGNIDLGPTFAYKIGDGNVLSASSTSGLTLVGLNAGTSLLATTTASAGMTALGYQALQSATSSLFDTAVGFQALKSAIDYTSGAGLSTFDGATATTSGSADTAIGYQALTANTTGNFNTAVGYQALKSITTSAHNTGIGYRALFDDTSGSNNTSLGEDSLFLNTTGTSDTGVGEGVMLFNTTGSNDAAVGMDALENNTTGSFDSVLGYGALLQNVSPTSTVAVGYEAGVGLSPYSNQGGTYVGFAAGDSVTTGSDYNTFLGYQAGSSVTTGADNIVIGPGHRRDVQHPKHRLGQHPHRLRYRCNSPRP